MVSAKLILIIRLSSVMSRERTNGDVWPWLSFVDDWARIRMGREKEAIDLVKRVARADLVMSGDW